MRRRTVLGSGLAVVAAGILPCAAGSEDAIGFVIGRLRTSRRKTGLPIFALHPALAEMAQRQVLHMHHLKQTTHAGPDGSDPPLRGRQVGYEGRIIGETQAETPTSAAEIVDEWLDYEGTRAVLLDPAARYAGVAGFRDNAGLLRIDLVVGA